MGRTWFGVTLEEEEGADHAGDKQAECGQAEHHQQPVVFTADRR
jgi:hypothetical protein